MAGEDRPYNAAVPPSDSKRAVGAAIETAPVVHGYSVFGLNVRSALVLPELFADQVEFDAPDVTIVIRPDLPAGELAESLEAADDAIVLEIAEIGPFGVSGGRNLAAASAWKSPLLPIAAFQLCTIGVGK